MILDEPDPSLRPLSEGLGSILKDIASGRVEEEVGELRKEAADVHTPEQQRVVLAKIVRLLEQLVRLRHGGPSVARFVHDGIGWFQKQLGTENAPKELNQRLGEAIADLARVRDKLLARRWDDDDTNRAVSDMRRKAAEVLDRARAARDGDM